MFLEIIIFSLIIVKFRGGRVKRILDTDIRGLKLIGLAVLVQVALGLLFTRRLSLQETNFSYINILTYLVFVYGIFLNRNLRGFKSIGFGSFLNFIPLVFNKGKMPVSLRALAKINRYDEIEVLSRNMALMHSLETSGTKFKYLTDLIPVRYIFPKVISLGDIFIGLGIFYFIYYYSKDQDLSLRVRP